MIKKSINLGILLSMLIALPALMTCDSLLGGDDIREIIDEEIRQANAPELTLMVRPDPLSGGGITSLAQTTQKVGVPFSVTATANSTHAFDHWAAFIRNADGSLVSTDKVQFSDSKETTCTVTILERIQNIYIHAIFERRPVIDSYSPTGDNQALNKMIVINFSKEVLNVTSQTIRIEQKSNNPTSVFADITDRFEEPQLYPGTLASYVIKFKVGAAFFNPNNQVRVSIDQAITDLKGNTLADGTSFGFTTGTAADSQPPTITSVVLKRGSTEVPSGSVVNTRDFNFFIDASDDDGIASIRIKRTDTNEELYNNSYSDASTAIPIRLTETEGSVPLRINAYDYNLNESESKSFSLIYDITPPTVNNFWVGDIDPASPFAGTRRLPIKADASDANGTPFISLSTDNSTWTDPRSFDTTVETDDLGSDGPVTVWARFIDAAGNVTTVTDSVVVDTVPPTISDTSFERTGGGAYAKTGDEVILEFSAHDAGTGLDGLPLVTIAGKPAIVSHLSGDSFRALLALDADTAEGSVPWQIEARDRANRISTLNSPSASGLVFDKTPPGISLTSFSSNATDVSYAKAGDKLVLVFTVNDGAGTVSGIDSAPLVRFSDAVETHTVTGDYRADGQYTFEYPLTDSSREGSWGYSIEQLDRAGNSDILSASSGVVFDCTTPSLTLDSLASSNSLNSGFASATDTVTLVFTLTDENPSASLPQVLIGGVAATHDSTSDNQYTFSASASSMSDGPIGVSVAVSDKAGNLATSSGPVPGAGIIRDGTTPSVSFESLLSNNGGGTNPYWAKDGDSVTLRFTVIEANLDRLEAWIGGVSVLHSLSGSTYTASINTSALSGITDGPITYRILAEDKAGNVTDTGEVLPANRVVLDRDAPDISDFWVGTSAAAATYANSRELKIHAQNSDNLGEVFIAYSKDNSNWTAYVPFESGSTSTGTLFDSDGPVTVYAKFKDNAGNESAVFSDSVTIDTEDPIIDSVDFESLYSYSPYAKPNDSVRLTFHARDSGAGLASSPLVSIGGVWLDPSSITCTSGTMNDGIWEANYILPDTLPQGDVSWEIRVTDGPGNEVTETGSGVILDKTAPEISLVSFTTDNAIENSIGSKDHLLTLRFTVSDNGTGDSGLPISFSPSVKFIQGTTEIPVTAVDDSGVWKAERVFLESDSEGAWGFIVEASDRVGNTAQKTSTDTVLLDRTPPLISFISMSSNNMNGGNSNPAWAKTGDEISLVFEVTEDAIHTISATIGGIEATLGTPSGSVYTATITANGSLPEELLSYEILVKDTAGNEASIQDSPSGAVRYDKTPPQFLNGNPTYTRSYSNTTGELIIYVEEDLSGVVAIEYLDPYQSYWGIDNIPRAAGFSCEQVEGESFYRVIATLPVLANNETRQYRLVDGAGNTQEKVDGSENARIECSNDGDIALTSVIAPARRSVNQDLLGMTGDSQTWTSRSRAYHGEAQSQAASNSMLDSQSIEARWIMPSGPVPDSGREKERNDGEIQDNPIVSYARKPLKEPASPSPRRSDLVLEHSRDTDREPVELVLETSESPFTEGESQPLERETAGPLHSGAVEPSPERDGPQTPKPERHQSGNRTLWLLPGRRRESDTVDECS